MKKNGMMSLLYDISSLTLAGAALVHNDDPSGVYQPHRVMHDALKAVPASYWLVVYRDDIMNNEAFGSVSCHP